MKSLITYHLSLITYHLRYTLALMATVMAMTASAQTMTVEQEREFYQKVYALFGVYSQSASVSDEEEEYTFRKLFASGDMQIANDLMSLSRQETLSVDEYITTLQSAKRVKVTVRNIKKDGPVEEQNGVWMLPVAFEKGMYYSKNGTLFDSYTYFGEYYRLRAVLALDKTSGECYIASLSADPKYKWLQFPETFTVLERTREDENKRDYRRDNKLTINNRDIRWNLYGQVMLRKDDVVKYNNSPVELEVVDQSPVSGTKMHAKYNDKLFRVRANMGFSIGGFNKLDDASSDINTPKDNEMSFGLDFGYVFPSTTKLYVGIFAGLGVSMNNLTMEMGPGQGTPINVPCKGGQDEDGNSYERIYTLGGSGISQELKATDITVPLYLDLEYQITPLISAYADIGARFQTSTGKWTANIDSYEVWGKYGDYNNLEIRGGDKGKDIDLNGFGSWPAREMDVDETDKSMTINILGGVGVRFNLSKQFAFDLGMQYLMGGNSWKNDDKPIFNYVLPSEATTQEEKAKGEQVNLLRKTSGIKHSALRVAASLIYKF